MGILGQLFERFESWPFWVSCLSFLLPRSMCLPYHDFGIGGHPRFFLGAGRIAFACSFLLHLCSTWHTVILGYANSMRIDFNPIRCLLVPFLSFLGSTIGELCGAGEVESEQGGERIFLAHSRSKTLLGFYSLITLVMW